MASDANELSGRLLSRTSWESRGAVRRFVKEIKNESSWASFQCPLPKGLVQTAVTASPGEPQSVDFPPPPAPSLSPRRRTPGRSGGGQARHVHSEPGPPASARRDSSGSELSDLECPVSASEDENAMFEEVWANPTAGGRYGVPTNPGVIQYREFCTELGCVPVSFYEKNFEKVAFEMNDHGLGTKGAIALAKSLVTNDNVASVALRGNAICGLAGTHFAAALGDNPDISELDLYNNSLCSTGTAAFAKHFAKGASRLTTLNMGQNNIMDLDGPGFTNGLKKDSRLEVLGLRGNMFGDFAAAGFAAMLRVHPALVELDLSENRIRHKGGFALASMLTTNSRLERLLLDFNGMGSRAAIALAEACMVNGTLKELSLRRCGIASDAACDKIAEMLSRNTELRRLDLSFNKLSETGAKKIIEAWAGQKSLEHLGLGGVRISEADQAAIEAILTESDGVRTCDYYSRYTLDTTKNYKEEAAKRYISMKKRREELEAAREATAAFATGEGRVLAMDAGDDGSGTKGGFASKVGGMIQKERRRSGQPGSGVRRRRKKGEPTDPTKAAARKARRELRRAENFENRKRAGADQGPGGGAGPARSESSFNLTGMPSSPDAVTSDSSDPETDDEVAVAQSKWRREKRAQRRWEREYPDLEDPMSVLETYVDEMKLRLVDLFFAIDKDRSGDISQQELMSACGSLGLDLDEVQKRELLSRMDTDGDGSIDYQELCEGRRRFASKLHADDPKWRTVSPDSQTDDDSYEDDDAGADSM